MDFIKYTLWPPIKVKLKYYWWILKYGGKKKIPPEVIFGALSKSVSAMSENIMGAVRASRHDMDPAEKEQVRELLMRLGSFESKIKNLKK